jgi:hypothetical protein
MNKTLSFAAAALLLAGVAQAGASTVVVNAFDPNGSVAGWLNSGESFSVTVDANDLWSAGGLPRFSNADGLITDLYSVAGDDSGVTPGVLIGQDWGSYGAFHYGELVGQIGSGPVFGVGTSFSGVADATGELKLFYWDSSYGDNAGSITATIAVPEPANIALLGLALGAFALSRRRKA